MNFSNFVIGVFGLYTFYYASNIIYDVFVKKDYKALDDEHVIDIGEEFEEEDEIPTLVEDFTEPEQVRSEETQHQEVEIDSTKTFIKMEVETQGIPFETLMKDSKSLFATVNY